MCDAIEKNRPDFAPNPEEVLGFYLFIFILFSFLANGVDAKPERANFVPKMRYISNFISYIQDISHQAIAIVNREMPRMRILLDIIQAIVRVSILEHFFSSEFSNSQWLSSDPQQDATSFHIGMASFISQKFQPHYLPPYLSLRPSQFHLNPQIRNGESEIDLDQVNKTTNCKLQ